MIKGVINDAVGSLEKESNTTDIQVKKRCAFCGGPDIDIVIRRGSKDLLVCLACYQGARAIQDTENERRPEE